MIKDLLKANLDKTLHANLFNSITLPVCEMWAATEQLVMIQRAMVRLVGFYNISTIVGYLMPNFVYTYIDEKISK